MQSNEIAAAVAEAKERYAREEAEKKANRQKAKQYSVQEREQRAKEKERFLSFDLSLDDMYRQSDARVYFMKSRQAEYSHPNLYTWDHPKTADKLLSRFKYNKKQSDTFEQMIQAAGRIGSQSLVAEYKEKADVHLNKCLYAHYGIGILYRQFVEEGNVDDD